MKARFPGEISAILVRDLRVAPQVDFNERFRAWLA
jgi:hypothetical protein